MDEIDDAELLAKFARGECERSFAALVERHIHLVHSVALRHTANPHHAEEITQAVFVILARKARSLGRRTVLSGWLYHAARLTAANFRRAESRRVRREQEAFMQSTLEANPTDAMWSELAPLLDDAMAGLRTSERDAVVMRYFESKSLPEVAAALGVAERAAQKRVSRALEKLRTSFTKRGVASTTVTIAGALAANSVQAAPAALAPMISTMALQGSAIAGSTLTLVKGTLHIMNWIQTKTAVAVAAGTLLVAGASVAVSHSRQAEAQLNQAQALQAKLEAERAAASKNLTADPNIEKLEAELKAQRAGGSQALPSKEQAERAAALANGPSNPDLQKLEAEEKARRPQQPQPAVQ